MMVNEAVLSSGSIAQLDTDGIRLRQDDGDKINALEFFLSYDDLRDLVALADALAMSATYNALRDRYPQPFHALTVLP